jgi:hypothetical protein
MHILGNGVERDQSVNVEASDEMEEDVDMLQNSLEDVESRDCASTDDPTTCE